MADICIIIPCFNEAHRLNTVAFTNFIKNKDYIDLYFINDASSDETASILNQLETTSPNIRINHLTVNSGKAEAIRQGLLSLPDTYKHVGYLDADLATPLEEIERLYALALKTKKTLVMGSRVKRIGANIHRRIKRHIFGRIIATCIDTFILKLGIYDTQCGAKIIEQQLAKELFEKPFKTKWLFDVELILRAKIKYGKTYCLENFMEVPLNYWHDKGQSKITFSDVLKLPFNFIKIYTHYR